MITKIILCLFITNLGTAFGAGLYEMRIVLPIWFRKTSNSYMVDAEAMERMNVGRNFWAMVTTIPLTLLTLVNLFFALKATGPVYSWWLAATIATLLDRVFTFSFFIPNAIKFAKPGAIPDDKLSSKVSQWKNANYLRILITFLSFVMALRAVLLL